MTFGVGDGRIFWQIALPEWSPLNIYAPHLTWQDTLMHVWVCRPVSRSKTLRRSICSK